MHLEWFPLYAKDALNDMSMRLMTSAERGMFWMLCFNQWHEDGLPDDLRALRVLAMEEDDEVFSAAWVTLEPLFPPGSDGLRRNPRLERVAKEQATKARQRRKIAKGAATARWAGVAEQEARDVAADARWGQAEVWLAEQTPAKRKATKLRVKRLVDASLGEDNGNIGDAVRQRLEQAELVQLLKKEGAIDG